MRFEYSILGFALFLVVACEKQQAVPKDIQGLYKLSPDSRAWAGCTIRLGDGVFAYEWFTDAMDDPKLKLNPRCGRYSLVGSNITLVFSSGETSHRVLTKGPVGYMLWETDDYTKYLSNRQASYSVLYQQSDH